ncbi:bifunctional 2-polyprenyl-6-hydroxyphenol methylase/3-demethylubiquinol 3-O-methyltransferase UbiG [Malonomonas rubra]|uniref:class I SAM-dependent methyltransferase n=1 Tax=Malonomonas rubra TaxID=57040 RepID=UPI0026EF95DC|nr:class I SAM-dependent methyltransferase [Malonomonas rubra]
MKPTQWDERYATQEYQYGTEANDFLRSRAEQLTLGKCLCLAEGEGRNAVYLAQLGHQVTAVDASGVGLRKAEQLARQRGITITTQVADLGEYAIDAESWDSIISIYCHVDGAIRPELHRKVVAGLRPGGKLILEAYRPEQLSYGTGGPPTLEKLMSLKQLQHELQGLKMLYAEELEREVLEGQLHTGIGAIVQIVAEKP